jgi:hypothetical protein
MNSSVHSTASLYDQVFFFFVALLWFVWFFLIFDRFQESNNYKKVRAIFLGASIAFVVSAFLAFVSIAYSGNSIDLDTVFISIFKSILFASLFSFLERLVRFLEDQEKTP